jgi:hypothetical protein
MKTLVATLLATSIFVAVALAVDTSFHTRLVTTSSLTIHVKDGQYITIKNFTQDQDPGQRGVIVAGVPPLSPTPTPTPTPTPIATPTATPNSTDLTARKTDNVGGHDAFPNFWTWTIHIANGGAVVANFSSGQTILSDNLPNTNVTYGSPQVNNFSGVSNSGAITCTIAVTDDLTCTTSGALTINPGGSFDVSITATPTAAGAFVNPRGGGGCSVDPNNVVTEGNESNNTCADTVVSSTPTPTPTPVSGIVLTASVNYRDTTFLTEFVDPIVIAGPATLTIDPVPGATLSITYRKSLQPIQLTPTPTP